MTTPRPDLSNHAITIETGEHECRIIANPRGQWMVVILGLAVLGIAILPLTQSKAVSRWIKRERKPSSDDIVSLAVETLPMVAAATTFAMVWARRRQMRAVQIIEGIVTVHTPDLPVSVHRFERSNLAGAQLHTGASGTELRVQRRNGAAIAAFTNYRARDLGDAVDTINSLVIANRHYGFEVILTPQSPPDAQ